MATTAANLITGLRIRVRGRVQGVGFRPNVWRLAHDYRLPGQVLNDGDGVLIDVWGEPDVLSRFTTALYERCPPLARIDNISQEPLSGIPASDFQIVQSLQTETHTHVVPDAATCPDCLDDMNDPANRRYRYPFTNCTHCGPRLSIIDRIPYDRCNTSMAVFKQCPECQAEYDDPSNRRFHAQPNACQECGPRVWLEPAIDQPESVDAIEQAHHLLAQGFILAIKGIGGFHLVCDATNEKAVACLRERKRRYAKPFALMASDLETISHYCELDDIDKSLLQSPAAPIVLLDRKIHSDLADSVAPGQKMLGFMLPYTPLHHLLLQKADHPLVMTSGNISDVPQIIDNESARIQLAGIADYWLMHDREIRHRIDDSVVRTILDKPRVLRRARGYAPTSLPLPPGFDHSSEILSYGGELKNTFCLIKDGQAILSQHMGDLEDLDTQMDYRKNLELYAALFDHHPEILAIDAHPEYLSGKLGREKAEAENLRLIEIQHHHAHLAACLADNNWPLDGKPVLGIIIDGLGYGEDGDLWGGEFLLADYTQYERAGHFKPVALIGGAQAMYEPWRNTYAHLMQSSDSDQFLTEFSDLELMSFLREKPLATLNAMIINGINTPLASSCGRLFDAVAAAIGVCRNKASYEGQAAIELESLIDRSTMSAETANAYPFTITLSEKTNKPCLDPSSMWQALLKDLQNKTAPPVIAARFHGGLTNGMVEMVRAITEQSGQAIQTIALSGGVFQNRILLERVTKQLETTGFQVISHSQIPANDGGLSLGQAVITLARQIKEKSLCA